MYLALRTAIIENALAPGTKLPEDSLGATFGVSRTIVRESLARLRAEGLVDTSRGRSATVANPSPAEAADTFDVRRALEREVINVIVDRWDDRMAATMRAHIEQEEQASANRDYPVSDRLGVEFHILLAELSSNMLLHKYVSEVALRCALILAVFGHDHDQRTSIDEHRALLAALQRGDRAEAVSILDTHLQAVQQRALQPAPSRPGLTEILSRYTPTSEN